MCGPDHVRDRDRGYRHANEPRNGAVFEERRRWCSACARRHAVNGEHVLRKIDSDGDNGHGLLLLACVDEGSRLHRGTLMPTRGFRRSHGAGKVLSFAWAGHRIGLVGRHRANGRSRLRLHLDGIERILIVSGVGAYAFDICRGLSISQADGAAHHINSLPIFAAAGRGRVYTERFICWQFASRTSGR